jgi:inorganic pyrophosphatase
MRFKKIFEEQPSEKQKEYGNYKKDHITWNGLNISIENKAGSYREGIDPDGNSWKTKMYYDYGYIKGTQGPDKDHIDVFIGPNKNSEIVFVINQKKNNGDFDEHKIILCSNTKKEAEKIYLKNYEKNWNKYFKNIQALSIDEFKSWLKNGNTNKMFIRN